MSSVSLNFNDSTYSSTNRPQTATLSGDLTSIETAINDNDSRITTVVSNYIKKDGSVDFTAKQSYSTDLTFSDDKELVAKKYVDDSAVLKASHNLPDGYGINTRISTSIAIDDLTVAIKGLDGNDPSSSNPVYIRVANEVLALTSALSVTVDDSADHFSWDSGKIQGNDGQLFVYAVNNNGTLQVAISPTPTLRTIATNYIDAGGQTGSAGHTNVIMSGTRNANNVCRPIGRINVKQADDNDWEAPAEEKIINSPIHETDWLTYTPQNTGFSSVATNTGQYRIVYKTVDLFINISGTSNATNFITSTPIIKERLSYQFFRGRDNGTIITTPALAEFLADSNVVNLYPDIAGGNWTASGTKDIQGPNFQFKTA